jgi:hypothetical protein
MYRNVCLHGRISHLDAFDISLGLVRVSLDCERPYLGVGESGHCGLGEGWLKTHFSFGSNKCMTTIGNTTIECQRIRKLCNSLVSQRGVKKLELRRLKS